MDPDLVRQQYDAQRESSNAAPAAISSRSAYGISVLRGHIEAEPALNFPVPAAEAFQSSPPLLQKLPKQPRFNARIAAYCAGSVVCGLAAAFAASVSVGLASYDVAAVVSAILGGAASWLAAGSAR